MFAKIALIGLLLVSTPLAAQEQTQAEADTNQVRSLAEGTPDVNADSYLLVDFQSGEELVSFNPTKRVEPASITKLMTAYVIYRELSKGAISIEDEVLISQKAWEMKGSRMFVEPGKKVPMEKMLRGLIVQSGNDAAVALAEHVAGTETAFVQRMNEAAKELGLMGTNYENVSGWPGAEHYTTARDIVTLTRALINDFPERYKLYSEKEFTYNNIKQYNRNKLLWRDPSVDGVKTGHTESAGYCLVTSAKRDNMRLISVVLGAESKSSRSESSQRLLEFGFRTFETHKLYKAGSVLSEVRIWQGEKPNIAAGVIDDLYVSLPKGRYDQLKGVVQFDKSITAPIRRGDVLGRVVLSDQDTILKEAPLFALEDVSEGGLWRRVSDSVQKFFAD